MPKKKGTQMKTINQILKHFGFELKLIKLPPRYRVELSLPDKPVRVIHRYWFDSKDSAFRHARNSVELESSFDDVSEVYAEVWDEWTGNRRLHLHCVVHEERVEKFKYFDVIEG